ncbi:hypothetical protein JR316_0012294 [Psilocybe cubensis]|uniref:Uncharacterized protein n=2 Tax=Psilocybe cubensis TaxID=181762 RepID=A0A8H8CGR1_PSICU|nr:hypothetical protein JR316_0012294 [Psilocybe cubensis]KAH9475183.1 hypothetical protein JR316_0012294 [Psilocybe cubensis]
MDSFFNLREIHFNEVRVQYNPDMVDTVVVHHELRILCVTSLREYSLGTLFCSLSTPGLQTLDVKVQENSPELFTEILTPFLQQSHCHLTELFLTITLESEDEQQLIHFLDVIPTLQKLHIKDPFWTTAGLGASFFDVLRLPSDNTTAFRLPVLEIFTYEGKLSTGCLESMMKSMLSRTKAFTIPSGSVTMKTFTVKSNLYEPTYNEYLTTDSGLPLGLMTEALDGWMDKQVLDDVVKCTQARTFKFMDRKGVVWVLSN